jgi:hypothetical protein
VRAGTGFGSSLHLEPSHSSHSQFQQINIFTAHTVAAAADGYQNQCEKPEDIESKINKHRHRPKKQNGFAFTSRPAGLK